MLGQNLNTTLSAPSKQAMAPQPASNTGGFGGFGTSVPANNNYSFYNNIKAEGNSLNGLNGQTISALKSNYGTYINGINQGIQQYGTGNGQLGLVNSFGNAADANATAQGLGAKALIGFEGGGQTAQNQALLAAQQQGYQNRNAYQATMASPQGQAAAQQYVQQLYSGLGVNNPLNQYIQQLYGDYLQKYGIDQNKPQQPTVLQSLAPIAAKVLPTIK